MSFLYEKLTRAYMMNEYADHRAAILWSRQEALLPAEQVSVERILRGRIMRTTPEYTSIKAKMSKAQRKLNELIAKYQSMEIDISCLLRGAPTRAEITAAGGTAELEKKVRAEAREFVRRCAHTDCNGFLSSAWKCGICSNYTCNECLEVKGKDRDAEHTCNADALATAKLLAKDTKPCPKCGIYINKSVGCDLMWCTSCQTPFSWSTLKISESRNIHNPHYFEFLQRTNGMVPRTPGDMVCGGIPDNMVTFIKHPIYKTYLTNVIRSLRHTQDIELRRYHDDMTLNEQTLKDLRIGFLLKDMTKEAIQSRLQLHERQRERAHSIHAILETLVTVGGDIVRNLTGQIENASYMQQKDILPQVFDQLEGLRVYINEQLAKISWLHNITAPYIDNAWYTIVKQKYPKPYECAPSTKPLSTLTFELNMISDYIRSYSRADALKKKDLLIDLCYSLKDMTFAQINESNPKPLGELLDELEKDEAYAELVMETRKHIVRKHTNLHIAHMNQLLKERNLREFPLNEVPATAPL